MTFVKAIMRVLVDDETSAEYYREQACEIDVDEDVEEFVSDEIEEMKQKKRALLERARELEAEDLPGLDELYVFLCGEDGGETRFNSMIDDILCWCTGVISPRIYIDKGEINISFVADFEKCQKYFTCDAIEDLEDLWNEEPFFKSRVGGHVGNYCKFPSRLNSKDLLCELTVDLRLVFVTDETGNVEYDPDEVESDIEDLDNLSDDEEEVRHPFFVTHESLFGPPGEVDLDLDTPPTKKRSWSKMFVPKPIRRLYKRIRSRSVF